MHRTEPARPLPMILRPALLLALMVFLAPAQAQAPDGEPALSRSASDADLEWGPCPPFLPAGCAIAVLRGDPAGNDADIFFKVPPGSHIPPHWHTSAERMVLISGELHVTYEGQAPTVLRPGMYAYGPAQHPHEGSCASAAPCVLFIAFEAPLDAVPVESAAPAAAVESQTGQ